MLAKIIIFSFVNIIIYFIDVEEIYIYLIFLSTFISLYKFRKNVTLFLFSIMLGYFNYSIIVHEYLQKNLRLTFHGLSSKEEFYLLMLKFILIFDFSYIYLMTQKKYQIDMKRKNNTIYLTLYICLLYIGIFKIKRNINFNEYTVMITPIYEYSYLLFGYLFLYSNNKKKIILSSILAIFFCLQDAYYGGRATSVQILIVLLLTLFIKYLSWIKIMFGTFIGVAVLSIIGGYREKIGIIEVINNLAKKLFFNDTSVMAFVSSITHIAVKEVVDLNTRLQSGFIFLKTLILGSNIENSNLADVTLFSATFFPNSGGGIFTSHIYFWCGKIGLIIVLYILFSFLDKIFKNKSNEYFYLVKIFIVSSFPRWYLYSPLSLIRGPIFLNLIIYTSIIIYKSFLKNLIIVYRERSIKYEAKKLKGER